MIAVLVASSAHADPAACARLALQIKVGDVGGAPSTRLLTNAQIITLCAKAGNTAIAPVTCLKNALALTSRDDLSVRTGVFTVDESVQLCAGAQ